MRYSARQLATILGVQPSTITRDIKKGRLSAARDDKGGYLIDASEIVRAYPDRVTVDVAGNVAATGRTQRNATGATDQNQRDATGYATGATGRTQSDATMDATAVLTARLEAAGRLLAEREQTIEDLRRRLDNEAEERRKLTARLVDHRENAAPVEPAPVSFWRRLFRPR